ncbi:MAG: Rad25-like DNA helicase [Phormidium sp. OSCR]|nr:MAG: Rad25-like DNA helicase [Phormidium sp. OSCR]
MLSRFRNGDYRTLVASHVLNEGVDVPEARVAILLSGSGSNREYIQRLGRVLRRGNDPGKQAILYEVISENTSEERTSKRRRGESQDRNAKPRPLTLVSKPDDPIPLYDRPSRRSQPRAAEEGSRYNSDEEDEQPE